MRKRSSGSDDQIAVLFQRALTELGQGRVSRDLNDEIDDRKSPRRTTVGGVGRHSFSHVAMAPSPIRADRLRRSISEGAIDVPFPRDVAQKTSAQFGEYTSHI